jgi:RNA recognition motif-containing protein
MNPEKDLDEKNSSSSNPTKKKTKKERKLERKNRNPEKRFEEDEKLDVEVPPSGDFDLFVKPKKASSALISRHLYVGKGGLAAKVSKQRLTLVFKVYGKLKYITSLADKTHAFVSFENVEDAKKALEELNLVYCQQLDRHLLISYAWYKVLPQFFL